MIIITITKVLHYNHSHPYHLHPVQLSRRALSAGSSSTAQRPSTDPLLPNLIAYIENLTFRGNLCFLHLRPPRPPPLLFGVACSLRSLLTYSVSFKVIFFCEFRWGSIVIYIVEGHGCPKRKRRNWRLSYQWQFIFLWGGRNGLSSFFSPPVNVSEAGCCQIKQLGTLCKIDERLHPNLLSYQSISAIFIIICQWLSHLSIVIRDPWNNSLLQVDLWNNCENWPLCLNSHKSFIFLFASYV